MEIPSLPTFEDNKNNLKATLREAEPTYKLNLNESYSLQQSLLQAEERKEITDALAQFLLDQYKTEGKQFLTIPFDQVTVKRTEDSFEFQIHGHSVQSKDSENVYQTHIGKSISLYLIKLIRDSRKPLAKHFRIRNDLDIVDSGVTFKARNSDKYQELKLVTILDDTLVFKKPLSNQNKYYGLPYEAFIHSKLQHQNIIRCYGYTKTSNSKSLIFQHLSTLLETFICNNAIDLKSRLKIVTELGQGLYFMHLKSVVSMNISPWSIFIDSNHHPIIADLENAVCVLMDQPNLPCYKEEKYASPEAKEGKRDIKCDVYSYGLVSFFILTGEHYADVQSYDSLNENLKTVFDLMLNENPIERPNVRTCYQEFNSILNSL